MNKARAINMHEMEALDPSSFVPLYVQIAERFSAAIRRSRDSLVGASLPSESDCVSYFGVSRPTVRQAMAKLAIEGLIVRSRGQGTFVAPMRINHDLGHAFEDEMRAVERNVRFKLLDRVRLPAPESARRALGLARGAQVERIHRLRLLEGVVIGFEERFVDLPHAGRISDESLLRHAIVTLIADFAGEPPTDFRLTISSIGANLRHARLLGVARGAPLLASEHTYFLGSGEPILYGLVVFNGERHQFTVETPIRPMMKARR